MGLSASVLARIEAMIDRGQVYSEPESLSATDKMLDVLRALGQRAATGGGSSVAHARAAPRPSPAEDQRGREVNWLDLPSLPELLETRRNLVRQDRGWRLLEASNRHPEN